MWEASCGEFPENNVGTRAQTPVAIMRGGGVPDKDRWACPTILTDWFSDQMTDWMTPTDWLAARLTDYRDSDREEDLNQEPPDFNWRTDWLTD